MFGTNPLLLLIFVAAVVVTISMWLPGNNNHNNSTHWIRPKFTTVSTNYIQTVGMSVKAGGFFSIFFLLFLFTSMLVVHSNLIWMKIKEFNQFQFRCYDRCYIVTSNCRAFEDWICGMCRLSHDLIIVNRQVWRWQR